MVDISATLVRELRDKTGAGMMDCKKALVASSGDVEKAIENLRKSGVAKAAKKAGRETTEGTIHAHIDGATATMVEMLCETDFVAKNDAFVTFLEETCASAIHQSTDDGDIANQVRTHFAEPLTGLIATVGENIQIRRAIRWHSAAKIGKYLHMGGRIGVLVETDATDDETFINDLCMHIAAFNPGYLSPDTVPADVVAKEKEIAASLPDLAGKPDAVRDKIIQGKLAKWFSENCLIKQPWVRDDKLTVEKVKPGVRIHRFLRWQVGEEL